LSTEFKCSHSRLHSTSMASSALKSTGTTLSTWRTLRGSTISQLQKSFPLQTALLASQETPTKTGKVSGLLARASGREAGQLAPLRSSSTPISSKGRPKTPITRTKDLSSMTSERPSVLISTSHQNISSDCLTDLTHSYSDQLKTATRFSFLTRTGSSIQRLMRQLISTVPCPT